MYAFTNMKVLVSDIYFSAIDNIEIFLKAGELAPYSKDGKFQVLKLK
jgi:hypothetical protein